MEGFEQLVVTLGELLLARGESLALAESCTGGWVSAEVTAVAGSSAWFERGFVTYSNAAKEELLGVPETTLARHGAVSEATARAMAQGTLQHSRADWSAAVTGIAGPGGGSDAKPVGTVCFAWARRDGACEAITCHFDGDRRAVRAQSVAFVLKGLLARIEISGLIA